MVVRGINERHLDEVNVVYVFINYALLLIESRVES